jgi:teichuronopeptide biosynthesis TupA-like protein
MGLLDLKYKGLIGYFLTSLAYEGYRFMKYYSVKDIPYLKKKFLNMQGYPLDIDNPKTLNEKLQWLKLYDRRPIYTTFADKYAVREWVKENIGEDVLIPLLYSTRNPDDIKPENLPDEPFILKANHDSGSYVIVRDKSKIDWPKVRTDCRWWLSKNYYWIDREYQYKAIEPRIIIEKLLVTQSGRIPNDYKIHCINGEIQFIYVAVDREGVNKRNIYDKDWKPFDISWANKFKDASNLRGPEIDPPASFERMIAISKQVAQLFAYVRVDFYDVDGKLYFGEITQCHGGGFDQMRPIEWDYKYGEMLQINGL